MDAGPRIGREVPQQARDQVGVPDVGVEIAGVVSRIEIGCGWKPHIHTIVEIGQSELPAEFGQLAAGAEELVVDHLGAPSGRHDVDGIRHDAGRTLPRREPPEHSVTSAAPPA